MNKRSYIDDFFIVVYLSNSDIFYFVLATFITLLATFPDGSFKIISAIFFRDSITLPPFAFVGSIKSLSHCVNLILIDIIGI